MSLIEAKPTLHDIAAMPFPASRDAMRKHYNPKWGRDTGDGELRTFKVKVRYSYRVHEIETVEVEACDEEEAERLAEDEIEKVCAEDFDIDDVHIVEPKS